MSILEETVKYFDNLAQPHPYRGQPIDNLACEGCGTLGHVINSWGGDGFSGAHRVCLCRHHFTTEVDDRGRVIDVTGPDSDKIILKG